MFNRIGSYNWHRNPNPFSMTVWMLIKFWFYFSNRSELSMHGLLQRTNLISKTVTFSFLINNRHPNTNRFFYFLEQQNPKPNFLPKVRQPDFVLLGAVSSIINTLCLVAIKQSWKHNRFKVYVLQSFKT